MALHLSYVAHQSKTLKRFATAIRIGNPQSWNHAKTQSYVILKVGLMNLRMLEILEAQRLLSMYEGVFVEPASAARLLAVQFRDIKAGKIAEAFCNRMHSNR